MIKVDNKYIIKLYKEKKRLETELKKVEEELDEVLRQKLLEMQMANEIKMVIEDENGEKYTLAQETSYVYSVNPQDWEEVYKWILSEKIDIVQHRLKNKEIRNMVEEGMTLPPFLNEISIERLKISKK